jgi:hypothetical protein
MVLFVTVEDKARTKRPLLCPCGSLLGFLLFTLKRDKRDKTLRLLLLAKSDVLFPAVTSVTLRKAMGFFYMAISRFLMSLLSIKIYLIQNLLWFST